MYLEFSVANSAGHAMQGIALEVQSVVVGSVTKHGIQMDIHHIGDELERVLLGRIPTEPLVVGRDGIRLTAFKVTIETTTRIMTKAEFREIIGVGYLLNGRGFYEIPLNATNLLVPVSLSMLKREDSRYKTRLDQIIGGRGERL